jgi:hypothetical protein
MEEAAEKHMDTLDDVQTQKWKRLYGWQQTMGMGKMGITKNETNEGLMKED